MKKTFVRVYWHHGDGSKAYDRFDDLDAYVCKGNEMRRFLDFLEGVSNIRKWEFSDECSFYDEGRYLVILSSVGSSEYEIVVYNLDRLRHKNKHGDRLELLWEW